jgi:hypothetical protein
VTALDDLVTAIRRGEPTAGVEPLTGGANNAVFRATVDGASVCLKRYRLDDRDRAGREWRALQLLNAECPGLAPRPIQLAPDDPPVVVMELVEGATARGRPLTASERGMLYDAYASLHRLTPSTVSVELPLVVGHPDSILARVDAGVSSFSPAAGAVAEALDLSR